MSKRDRKFNLAQGIKISENTALMELYTNDPEFRELTKVRIYKRSLESQGITEMELRNCNNTRS